MTVLTPEEAKRRFLIFFVIKLLGVAGIIGAVLLLRAEQPVLAGVAGLVGVAGALLRPRHLFSDMRE